MTLHIQTGNRHYHVQQNIIEKNIKARGPKLFCLKKILKKAR